MDDHNGVSPLGSFLLPEGFEQPGVSALLREGSVVAEFGRYALAERRARRREREPGAWARTARHRGDPVLLVPGFLAGDYSLAAMSRSLRREGYRTYRAHISANVGCTLTAATLLESRLEQIAARRGEKVAIIGHSLGGMLARGLAVRRPDLVSSIVTMGSPMLAPGAHHVALSIGVEALVRLSRAGLPGMMSEDCVAGACARESFEESQQPMPDGVGFTAIYSKRDGIVDWRACIDPGARRVEVTASHVGMALDPRVSRAVIHALGLQGARAASPRGSVLEVDRSESA